MNIIQFVEYPILNREDVYGRLLWLVFNQTSARRPFIMFSGAPVRSIPKLTKNKSGRPSLLPSPAATSQLHSVPKRSLLSLKWPWPSFSQTSSEQIHAREMSRLLSPFRSARRHCQNRAASAVNMALTADHGWVFSDRELAGWLSGAGLVDFACRPLPPPMRYWLATARNPSLREPFGLTASNWFVAQQDAPVPEGPRRG